LHQLGAQAVVTGACDVVLAARGSHHGRTVLIVVLVVGLTGKCLAHVMPSAEGIHERNGFAKEKSLQRWLQAFYLARLAGFEPTTPWFVAKYITDCP